jgi:hypothetical protein
LRWIALLLLYATAATLGSSPSCAAPSVPKGQPECLQAASFLKDTITAFNGNDTDEELILETEIWKYLCGRRPLTATSLQKLAQTDYPTVTGLFITLLATSTFFDLPNYSELSLE